MTESGGLAGFSGKVFRTERVAAEAGDGGGVDELGEDDRDVFRAAEFDQAFDVGQDFAARRDFQGGAGIENLRSCGPSERFGRFGPCP